MKGIVFTLFLEMVDETFSPEMTERIISISNLPSKGAYTTVGTYEHSEIVSLVTSLSKATDIEVSNLIRTFGTYLLKEFYELFPEFFSNINDPLDFLEMVDGYIHGEVLKLYPDASLPKIETKRLEPEKLLFIYKSDRMMGDLAEGLIAGAIDHFGGNHSVVRNDLEQQGTEQWVHFTITTR